MSNFNTPNQYADQKGAYPTQKNNCTRHYGARQPQEVEEAEVVQYKEAEDDHPQ